MVDGRVVFDRSGVSSDPTISFADTTDVETDAGRVKVKVSVEGGPTEEATVNTEETPFVEIWRSEQGIDIRATDAEVPML